ncbi:ATP-binding cassette domain-containing protein [Desulfobacter curvatus]|uniref:ATP-binding cassette domain-containing protein n=1 Tax=Desulfobacter curvatus TaxID=2290 RepID=UPI00035CA936|nr:ATP-binding cassette domain-containing protein [Desulfobacter curvatus]
MPDQPVIILNDIQKSCAGVEVLKGICLTANKGEVISIIGSSGSGKSTLLRCINLLVTPDAGTVEVCSSTVEMKQKRANARGMVLPDATIVFYDNVDLGYLDLIARRIDAMLG